MKKAISFLTSVTLVSASSTAVVSCSRPTDNGTNGTAQDLGQYAKLYNYQTGPMSQGGYNLNNDYITSFDVNAQSSYSAYNTASDTDIYNPTFYGDKANYLTTRDDNFKLSGWLNDDIQFQNVLALKRDLSKYKNLSYTVKDVTRNIKPDQKLAGKVSFEKYILSKKFDAPIIADSLLAKRQYVPDAVWDTHIDAPVEKVSDDEKSFHDVYFDIWNGWGSLKSTKSTSVGEHDIDLTISFTYDGKSHSYDKKIPVKIKPYVLDKSTDVDNNGDGKVDQTDRFGFSTGTYPAASIKMYSANDTEKPLKDIPVVRGWNDKTPWKAALDKSLDPSKAKITQTYISYGANLTATISGNDISFSTNTPKQEFMASYKVEDGKNACTYSVYYNEKGIQTYSSQNATNYPSGHLKADLNSDGTVNEKDWDVNQDGVYDSEDYDADKAVDKKGNPVPDEIGPAPYHGDYWELNPQMWSRISMNDVPVGQENSFFITAAGKQKQLIQWTGELNDPSYKIQKNNGTWTDDYEDNLAAANKSPDAFKKFITSTKSHTWKWSFDFHNLDLYMRVAAEKNIPEVMINPVDMGGFSFWYLKDQPGKKALVGPQRTMISAGAMTSINKDTGKLTEVGHAYVDNVISHLAHALSEHLASINNEEQYKTKYNKKPVKIYFTFDENNESLIDSVMDTVHKNSVAGGRIYSSAYLQWRSNISNQSIVSPAIDHDINDVNLDQMVMGWRELSHHSTNDELLKFRRKILAKEKEGTGKTFMIYSTWDAFPGGYMQSDLSDPYWQLFFADKIGINGWIRWSYDYLYRNYFKDSTVEPYGSSIAYANGGDKAPGGDSFLSYGGDDQKGVYYSTRLLSYINAVNYVYKMKYLLNQKLNKNYSHSQARILTQGLAAIGQAPAYKYSNNDYKWNVVTLPPDRFERPGSNYDVSTSLQVSELVRLIDSL